MAKSGKVEGVATAAAADGETGEAGEVGLEGDARLRALDGVVKTRAGRVGVVVPKTSAADAGAGDVGSGGLRRACLTNRSGVWAVRNGAFI